jgi:hypothetical protein
MRPCTIDWATEMRGPVYAGDGIAIGGMMRLLPVLDRQGAKPRDC